MRIETWGEGGYDPSKPNNNLIEVRHEDVPEFEEDESSEPRKSRTALAVGVSALLVVGTDLLLRLH